MHQLTNLLFPSDDTTTKIRVSCIDGATPPSATVFHNNLWRYIKSKGTNTGHFCSFYCGVLCSNIGPEMC